MTSDLDPVFQRLCRAAAHLPEVEQASSYGTPSLKLRGKFLARVKDADTVVLLCPLEEKEMLVAAAADIYFETDHYKGRPVILARVPVISDEELRHRLERAWRMKAPKRLMKSWEQPQP